MERQRWHYDGSYAGLQEYWASVTPAERAAFLVWVQTDEARALEAEGAALRAESERANEQGARAELAYMLAQLGTATAPQLAAAVHQDVEEVTARLQRMHAAGDLRRRVMLPHPKYSLIER